MNRRIAMTDWIAIVATLAGCAAAAEPTEVEQAPWPTTDVCDEFRGIRTHEELTEEYGGWAPRGRKLVVTGHSTRPGLRSAAV